MSNIPLETSPVVLFFAVTVKLPAAKMACPETWELLPLALMLQGEVHPGPLKKTVEFDESKFDPDNVSVNACPLIGGLGEVVSWLITGATGGFDTVSEKVSDDAPPEPLRTCTVNEPAAKTAAPLTCVVVLVSPETTHDVLVGHPGPRKNTSAFDVL